MKENKLLQDIPPHRDLIVLILCLPLCGELIRDPEYIVLSVSKLARNRVLISNK